MFGRHFGSPFEGKWAARHGWRGHFGPGAGHRARHGYEIIKVLEDKTAGWYSPSPGIVYPTLTVLEEAGYVTAQTEGAKKLYTITDEGRAYLDQNRDFVDAVLERLAKIGSKIARVRKRFGRDEDGDEDDRRGMP